MRSADERPQLRFRNAPAPGGAPPGNLPRSPSPHLRVSEPTTHAGRKGIEIEWLCREYRPGLAAGEQIRHRLYATDSLKDVDCGGGE
jgi:hypothetical protein